jgi:hypothetical protein
MTPKAFARHLEKAGFHPIEGILDSPAWYREIDGHRETVHLRNSMGGAYVLHLGHDCEPRDHRGLTGERWFEYIGGQEKRQALEKVWGWLCSIGFAFLRDPQSRPLHEWQTNEEILVRQNGRGIDIPRKRRLP